MTVLTTFFVVNNMLLTTRYDTLQHATIRYNTLQHSTTHYNILRHATTLRHITTLQNARSTVHVATFCIEQYTT
jgi:hypothetical protein